MKPESRTTRWFRELVLDNPVYQREVRSRWFRCALWAAAAVALGAVLLGAAGSVLLRRYSAPGAAGGAATGALVTLQAIVALALLTSAPAIAWLIAREHGRGTFGPLAVTPLTSRQILAGKMTAVLVPLFVFTEAWLTVIKGLQLLYALGPSVAVPPSVILGELLWAWLTAPLCLICLGSLGALVGVQVRSAPLAAASAALLAVFCTGVLLLEIGVSAPRPTINAPLGSPGDVGRWVVYLILAAWFSRLACRRLDRLRMGE